VAVNVLLIATMLGLVWRSRQGRLRHVRGRAAGSSGISTGGSARVGAITLLQFSAPACGPCRRLRAMCADVAAANPLVQHVDVDVATDLGLARAHGVRRTPTLIVLDPSGTPVWQAVGVPRRHDLDAAVTGILDRQVVRGRPSGAAEQAVRTSVPDGGERCRDARAAPRSKP
jgi:thiol-disulfide isomerase/thioredoxin